VTLAAIALVESAYARACAHGYYRYEASCPAPMRSDPPCTCGADDLDMVMRSVPSLLRTVAAQAAELNRLRPAEVHPAPAETLYYFLSRRPFREGEETCTWWGPDQIGLHGDLASAGKYLASALQTDTDQVCAIECEIVDALAVAMVDRKHFNRLVAARFIPPTG